MKSKLALITGATGFLGRNLCKKLIENIVEKCVEYEFRFWQLHKRL